MPFWELFLAFRKFNQVFKNVLWVSSFMLPKVLQLFLSEYLCSYKLFLFIKTWGKLKVFPLMWSEFQIVRGFFLCYAGLLIACLFFISKVIKALSLYCAFLSPNCWSYYFIILHWNNFEWNRKWIFYWKIEKCISVTCSAWH